MKRHTRGPVNVDRFGLLLDSHRNRVRIYGVAPATDTADGEACDNSLLFMEAINVTTEANATPRQLLQHKTVLLAAVRKWGSECAECWGKGVSEDTGEDCKGCADIRAVIAEVGGA